MAQFQYTAKKIGGQSIQGEIVATSSQEAIQLLRRQEMFVMRLTEKLSGTIRGSQWNWSLNHSRISQKDLVLFTHQFATLIRAGVPLLECLEILGTEANNPAWQPMIAHIRSEVERGVLLAQALGHFPAIFHEFYRRMVEVGETTGRLDESLSQLAAYLDKQAQLRAKIISALAYPGFTGNRGLSSLYVFAPMGCAIVFWPFPRVWGITALVNADSA